MDTHLGRRTFQRRECRQPLRFLSDRVELAPCKTPDRPDVEGRRVELPVAGDKAIDEEGAHEPVAGEDVAVIGGNDPGAVGMGEDRVVERGQETSRGWRLRMRERPVGYVEQLTTSLVFEAASRPRSSSVTWFSPVIPDQARMSWTVAGPKAVR